MRPSLAASLQFAASRPSARFGFVMAYAWFKVSDLITPLRVPRETELEGLDIPEMGALAYPDFAVHTPVVHGTSASEVAA